METPELPEGYFFRVLKGGFNQYFDEENCEVQIRQRVYHFWTRHVFSTTIGNTCVREPTKWEIFEAMERVKRTWEESKTHVSLYGDYPPKTLGD